jgi:PP-loop family
MIKVDLVADMDCDRCGRPALIFQPYSGLHLCKVHVRDDVLRKAKKTIRQQSWLKTGDTIAVACTGGPGSIALLDFMKVLLAGRKDIRMFAILMENDDNIMEIPGTSCEDTPAVDFIMVERGELRCPPSDSQDPFRERHETETFLIRIAKTHGATGLAMPYSIEDHAEWVLWKAISGEMPGLVKKLQDKREQFRILRPFLHIPGNELDIYASTVLNGYNPRIRAYMPDKTAGTCIRKLLEDFSCRHPGTRFALVNIWNDISQVVRQPGCSSPPGGT